MSTETRAFRMHPKLLMDVIRRQAGSLAKAILEGVMNSIDAGATRCTVELTGDHLAIDDDGAGFAGREAITTFFEVFGQPHDDDEKARKTYGTFRMGRGQLFAFGRNRWGTGEFRMTVDVQAKGLDYDLREGCEPLPGCVIHVELYEPLLPSDLAATERTVRHWLKWAPIPVTWNGETISRDPAEAAWDHVTDDAYVRLKAGGSLAVYNLGVHVCDLDGFRYGCGGEVVSRQPLTVNFARNDIQANCPVWRRVARLIDQRATTANTKKTTLDDAARQRLADQWRRGELEYREARGLRLFTAVNGRQHAAVDLRGRVTAGPKGSLRGDKLHQSREVFVLADETLERFGFPAGDAGLAGLIAWLNAADRRGDYTRIEPVPFADAAATYSEAFALVPAGDLSPRERTWLAVADAAAWAWLAAGRARGRARRLHVGASDTADGWTDGAAYIAIDRKFLARCALTPGGVADVVALLVHEYTHDGPDTAEHVHGMEFYEAFHEGMRLAGTAVEAGFRQIPRALAREGRRPTRAQLAALDVAALADRASAEGDAAGGAAGG